MRVLRRYLVRQFIPPLLFAFAAMTSIMLLNQVARRFGALVGKGLPWSVIGDVFLLSLPFIIAMTLPMAVLVAMLYTFSHLAADNEITAMRASGLSVYQLLRPMLAVGLALTAFNFWFTDQVLPESNARLRNLLFGIQRKKPTLELREQVINEIPPSGLFLRASRIDPKSGRLRSVTLYDLGNTDSRRIIYADSGIMGFAENLEDLHFRLFSGSIHTFKASEPSAIQVTAFATNDILVRNVSNRLDLESGDAVRGDREMSTCEMMEVVREAQREQALASRRRAEAVTRDLRTLLGLETGPPGGRVEPMPLPAYCRWFRALRRLTVTAERDSAAQEARDTLEPPLATAIGRAGSPPPVPPTDPRQALAATKRLKLAAARAGADVEAAVPLQGVAPQPAPPPPRGREVVLTQWGEVAAAIDQIRSAELRADQYAVEVHKKWAISVACLVFVIVGVPMALRFPRGGMGLVIGGGLFVFAIYYIGLIAGEGLGDKNIVPPWVAMWAPNLIFATLGVYGLYRVNRESGSTRGGDLAELWDTLTAPFRRRKAA
ncbi:MAG TPA: LptF/LptG family permease [Gemmatimonadales bacterium]|nr:LptF/LptG family permease [Gemmatimonadales bacterium]